MSEQTRQHLAAMRIAQADIHKGDTNFYVVTANGHKVSGAFKDRGDAGLHLAWLRHRAENDEDDAA